MGAPISAGSLEGGAALELRWEDGSASRFHAFWLRDNAPDPGTRSPANHQRLITLDDVPPEVRVSDVAIEDDAVALRFVPGDLAVRFPIRWLREHDYDRPADRPAPLLPPGCESWDASLDVDAVTARHAEVLADAGALCRWLAHVRRFGFARLRGGPIESGALLDIVASFGFVRTTHYGEVFEVRTEIDPSNLAYTDAALQAHTDNPYRDPVPTLQVLYCLESSARGGESRVVDGFRAAERLRAENPAGFASLARHRARFEYRGADGVCLQARRPMLELGPDGELLCVRFNNRSVAPIVDVPYDAMPGYYAAYRRFGELVDDSAMAASFRLEPGESFIVDNTRVLHGRTGFASSAGSRRLQGCYADRDGLLSTLAAFEARARHPGVAA